MFYRKINDSNSNQTFNPHYLASGSTRESNSQNLKMSNRGQIKLDLILLRCKNTFNKATYISSHKKKSIEDKQYMLDSADELTSDLLQWTPTQGHSSIGRPAKTSIHMHCVDARCCLEDFTKAKTYRDGWQERFSRIRAVGIP